MVREWRLERYNRWVRPMAAPSQQARSDLAVVSEPERIRVLAIDDQAEVFHALRRLLKSRGFDVEGCTASTEALARLEAEPSAWDLVLLDVNMPGMSGLEVLPRLKEIVPDVPVIMLTADDRATTAVEALKAGAFNYLTKPLADADAVALTLSRAGSVGQLQRRARVLESQVSFAGKFERLIGASASMRALYTTIEKLARTDVNVLIRGESGTGKELVARAIHSRSGRQRGPFVALNCGAIPEALIDSELFGHAKGAFTGAIGARLGVFGEADDGTLFLDEIGDVPLPVQSRMLRALQEREVRAVGANGSRKVDVRVLAATHVDLDAAVESKQFRADLYYRLNVVSVYVPPLRERMEDIPVLAAHFVEKHSEQLGRPIPRLTADAIRTLSDYDWPGNVRELENAIQHALALVPGDVVSAEALPHRIEAHGLETATSVAPPITKASGSSGVDWADELAFNDARKRAQREFEHAYLSRLLERTSGNVSEAARVAGLDRSNLRRVLSRHDIDPERYRDS